ncbi:MAG: hypothetical protein N0E55_12580 [Candidatus Thiodiazotropha taylori]|nr:hypothetical protein [Candidatus Thiodiazotropha taylori]MCW4253521.1 hypothetical protein [Candidatus Thiodiazotropha taylori]
MPIFLTTRARMDQRLACGLAALVMSGGLLERTWRRAIRTIGVMANLLSSPTHCSNIMDPKFREFGSAVIDTDQAHYYNYWTQVFGAR